MQVSKPGSDEHLFGAASDLDVTIDRRRLDEPGEGTPPLVHAPLDTSSLPPAGWGLAAIRLHPTQRLHPVDVRRGQAAAAWFGVALSLHVIALTALKRFELPPPEAGHSIEIPIEIVVAAAPPAEAASPSADTPPPDAAPPPPAEVASPPLVASPVGLGSPPAYMEPPTAAATPPPEANVPPPPPIAPQPVIQPPPAGGAEPPVPATPPPPPPKPSPTAPQAVIEQTPAVSVEALPDKKPAAKPAFIPSPKPPRQPAMMKEVKAAQDRLNHSEAKTLANAAAAQARAEAPRATVAAREAEAPRAAAPVDRGEPSAEDVAAYGRQIVARIAALKDYPDAARERGAEGTAVVRFSIGPAGQVTSAAVAQSTGDPTLDAAALATVHRASPFGPPPRGAARSYSAPLRYRMR